MHLANCGVVSHGNGIWEEKKWLTLQDHETQLIKYGGLGLIEFTFSRQHCTGPMASVKLLVTATCLVRPVYSPYKTHNTCFHRKKVTKQIYSPATVRLYM